jgi:hypothetical protein
VAHLAPAQNFNCERLTITHVPHDQPTESKARGRCQSP